MKIIKSQFSSKCTDGAIVTEYTFDLPVDDAFLQFVRANGDLSIKQLGTNTLFTFSCDLFSMKGMVGDTIIYITNRKENSEKVHQFLESVFDTPV